MNKMDRLRTLDGGHFFGRVSPISFKIAKDQNSDWFHPRRLLTVHPGCRITSGQIVKTGDGNKFLTYFESEDSNTRNFRLYDLDKVVEWKRVTTVTDPVTKLPRSVGVESLGLISCAIEAYGQKAENILNTEVNRFFILTNADLKLNDIVSGYTIHVLNRDYGVTVATAW